MKKHVVVAVSGGFDPIHIGHVRLFQEAKALGNELRITMLYNVGAGGKVQSSSWLIAKAAQK